MIEIRKKRNYTVARTGGRKWVINSNGVVFEVINRSAKPPVILQSSPFGRGVFYELYESMKREGKLHGSETQR